MLQPVAEEMFTAQIQDVFLLEPCAIFVLCNIFVDIYDLFFAVKPDSSEDAN